MLEYVYIALFVSFPEALLIYLIGFSLSNIENTSLLKLLTIAAIQSVVALLIMMLGFSTGYATMIQISSLYFLVLAFFPFPYYKALVPVLIGAFFQGALQSVILPIIKAFTTVDITRLSHDFRSAIVCFLPIFFVSVLLYFIIRKKNYYICDIK